MHNNRPFDTSKLLLKKKQDRKVIFNNPGNIHSNLNLQHSSHLNFNDYLKSFVILTGGLLLMTCFFSCRSKPEPEHILARIGDKEITTNEFIYRAEYTPRPAYCRDENYIHRKIVLNSLITEKLYAMEAGENNELTSNEDFRYYMQGRREQAMRQWLYQKEMLDKVKIDTAAEKKYYEKAGRAYNISFINCPTKEAAAAVKDQLSVMGHRLEDVYYTLTGDTALPKREIRFDSEEAEIVFKELYYNPVEKNQIIGPLQITNGDYVVMRVDGWTNHVAMSDKQQQERLQSVREKLTDFASQKIFREYAGNLMAGKRLEFERNTFEELVSVIGPEYFKTEEDKREAFNKKFWNKDQEEMVLDDAPEKMERLRDKKLLTIDGETWTVADFEKALKIHPLVFRNRKMSKGQFAAEFRLAIADMIRDQYITKDAYKRGYDRVADVERTVAMWRDNLLALYRKKEVLDSLNVSEKDQYKLIRNHLDPYAAQLRQKYNDQIKINTDEFEKTKLTRIDMFVVQKNVPFPVMVPGFPQLTTHDMLNYGNKMNVTERAAGKSAVE